MDIPKSERTANPSLFLVENLWRAPNEKEMEIFQNLNPVSETGI